MPTKKTKRRPTKKSKKRHSIFSRLFRPIAGIFFLLVAGSVVFTVFFRFVNPPITSYMIVQCVKQAFDNERNVSIHKEWKDISTISPWIIRAVIASEDHQFLFHNGFKRDVAPKNRLLHVAEKKLMKNPSISIQTAQSTFVWAGNSCINKGLCCYYTLLMEFFWDKERIMEVFLNTREWGDGIYGVEAAAEHYFHKSAEDLSEYEAAVLAACLHGDYKKGVPPSARTTIARAQSIIYLMRLSGPVNLHPNNKH